MARDNTLRKEYFEVQQLPEGMDTRPVEAGALNNLELQTIYGLLAWVEYEQEVRQDVAQMLLEAEFGVSHVSLLRQADYEAIVRYLIDLRIDRRH